MVILIKCPGQLLSNTSVSIWSKVVKDFIFLSKCFSSSEVVDLCWFGLLHIKTEITKCLWKINCLGRLISSLAYNSSSYFDSTTRLNESFFLFYCPWLKVTWFGKQLSQILRCVRLSFYLIAYSWYLVYSFTYMLRFCNQRTLCISYNCCICRLRYSVGLARTNSCFGYNYIYYWWNGIIG